MKFYGSDSNKADLVCFQGFLFQVVAREECIDNCRLEAAWIEEPSFKRSCPRIRIYPGGISEFVLITSIYLALSLVFRKQPVVVYSFSFLLKAGKVGREDAHCISL